VVVFFVAGIGAALSAPSADFDADRVLRPRVGFASIFEAAATESAAPAAAGVPRIEGLRPSPSSFAKVRRTVIDDQTPFVPLAVPRALGEFTELEAQQVKIGER
jgi:hypothetical protein